MTSRYIYDVRVKQVLWTKVHSCGWRAAAASIRFFFKWVYFSYIIFYSFSNNKHCCKIGFFLFLFCKGLNRPQPIYSTYVQGRNDIRLLRPCSKRRKVIIWFWTKYSWLVDPHLWLEFSLLTIQGRRQGVL